jgi:ABC-type nitrate/sulfonate/bicarbonate transport system ATPase subunit
VFLKELSGTNHVKPWNLVSKKKTTMAEEALAAVGLGNISPSAAASTLTPGLRQMLAMSRTCVAAGHRTTLSQDIGINHCSD